MPEIIFGYECPCGERFESESELELTTAAWDHARTCSDEAHAVAREQDVTYGSPDHFHFEPAEGAS